jgi:hypothetical protein
LLRRVMEWLDTDVSVDRLPPSSRRKNPENQDFFMKSVFHKNICDISKNDFHILYLFT